MRCNKADILLSAFLDKELNNKESAKLEKHLEECAKCREKLENLKYYAALPGLLSTKEAPLDLIDNVWASIRTEINLNIPGNKPKQQISNIRFTVAAAIAAIIIGGTLIPINLFKNNQIIGQFYTENQKGGKGPARINELPTVKSHDKGQSKGNDKKDDADPRLIYLEQLANKYNADIIELKYIPGKQKLSRIILKIPADKYHGFRKEYNTVQTKNPLPELRNKRINKNLKIIINFPVHRFVLGDFSGDGSADMLVHSYGLKNNSTWHISEMDSLLHFDYPNPFNSSIDPSDATLISGDINGDSFDDIILVGKSDPFIAHIYTNSRGKRFKKPYKVEFRIPAFIPGEVFYLSGDINGDGRDDLILHLKNQDKPGPWFFMQSFDDGKFTQPQIINPDNNGWEGTSRYLPFVADLNGDGLDDTGIYGQSGERNAWWYVSINLGNGEFEEEKNIKFGKASLAFQGEYWPLWGDLNADGLDDFIIKYGKESSYSKWTKELNTSGLVFSGSNLDFSGKEDFKIK